MWRVFCKLVDFGGAVGNPRERKILHICDSDYTTWGGGKDPRHRRVAPSFVVPIRFLWMQWRENVEVSDHVLNSPTLFYKALILWGEIGRWSLLRWCYTGRFPTIFNTTYHFDNAATFFRMVATLFQHCYAVLRKNSSLRIVTCHSRPQSPSFLAWSVTN